MQGEVRNLASEDGERQRAHLMPGAVANREETPKQNPTGPGNRVRPFLSN